MAKTTDIEWTDATWNPITGCTKIGPGCDNCYAARFAERWRGIKGHSYEQGFDLRLWPSRIDQPLKWRKPRLVFVNSMSDLFQKKVPKEFIDAIFETMECADHHTYQVLPKRSSLMRGYVNRRYPNVPVPDPNQPISIWPYIADDVQSLGLSVSGVTTIKAERTFWDKVLLPMDCETDSSAAASFARRDNASHATTMTCIVSWKRQSELIRPPTGISELIASLTPKRSSIGRTTISTPPPQARSR